MLRLYCQMHSFPNKLYDKCVQYIKTNRQIKKRTATRHFSYCVNTDSRSNLVLYTNCTAIYIVRAWAWHSWLFTYIVLGQHDLFVIGPYCQYCLDQHTSNIF